MFRAYLATLHKGNVRVPLCELIRDFRGKHPDAQITRRQAKLECRTAGYSVGKDSIGRLWVVGLSLRPIQTWQVEDGRLIRATTHE